MSLHPPTKERLLEAMQEFDRTHRGAAEWERWEDNKAHKYAIRHEGQLYPVKKIVSLASGVPVSEFSGGKGHGQANQIAQQAGFTITDLRPSNPDWTRDELIIALDFYLRHRPNPPGKDSAAIAELSRTLGRLGERLFSPEERSETFRNENGVYMKLMNLRRFDPQYTAEGKVGLARGSQAEEDVWNEFGSDPARCQNVAAAIVKSLDDDEVLTAAIDHDIDDGIEEAPEGRLLTRKHLARERNRKLVESKRKKVLRATGALSCEACGFDFAQQYGKRGEGFIECHHTRPVATLAEGHKTHVDDLALVCANCHRMIHRSKPWLAMADLKALLISERNSGKV